MGDEDTNAQVSRTNMAKLEEFMDRLPKCVNRELIDGAAIEFCYIATKGTRKKLANFLFHVPRTELVLLPYYSRLVATLHPVYPDTSKILLDSLLREFKHQIRKKDQTNIESKIKTVKFLGELTKFKISPPISV